MGSFLDKPKTEKDTHVQNGNGLRVGVSAMQGWRIDMEVRAAEVVVCLRVWAGRAKLRRPAGHDCCSS